MPWIVKRESIIMFLKVLFVISMFSLTAFMSKIPAVY